MYSLSNFFDFLFSIILELIISVRTGLIFFRYNKATELYDELIKDDETNMVKTLFSFGTSWCSSLAILFASERVFYAPKIKEISASLSYHNLDIVFIKLLNYIRWRFHIKILRLIRSKLWLKKVKDIYQD